MHPCEQGGGRAVTANLASLTFCYVEVRHSGQPDQALIAPPLCAQALEQGKPGEKDDHMQLS